MGMLETIRDLEGLAPRRGASEERAKRYIEARLTDFGVEYEEQGFENPLPKYRACRLEADGKAVEAMPTAFRSGYIDGKPLISSMDVSGRYHEKPNINFNPYSDSFSLATFYRAPSVAIRRSEVKRIIAAEEVSGKVLVSRQRHRCANIIAGNAKNPETVLICHYDSVLNGALDNASGVATLLEIAKTGPKKGMMLVFSGCEELSFDSPVYWGRGYRELERDFKKELKSAKRIVVADMLGSSSPAEITDPASRLACFPIKDKKMFERARMLSVSGKEWFGVYHSMDDRAELLKRHLLEEGLRAVLSLAVG
ncbi:MAG: M28 family peptidase [Candidatus Micrarchaeota archaeon]|nr:M28 family peptidase [Candidatus Micrarchaeota archaeon]